MPITRSAAKRAAQSSDSLPLQEVTPRPLPKLLFGHPPELANHIFQDVDPIDLLNLATVSKSSRALVESLCIKVDSISIRYCSDGARITIRTAKDTIFVFEITSLVEENRRDETIRSIGDCEFVMNYSGERFAQKDYTIHCSDKDQLAMILARFFFVIYRTEDVSLDFDCPRNGLLLDFIRNVNSRFSKFEIAADVKLTDKEFRVVMEDISVSGEFEFESSHEHNYDRPFQHKKMSLNMPWKPSNLIGMRCEELSLYKLEFSAEDLKTFAQSWKEGGGMTQLKEIIFAYEGGYSLGMSTKDQVWTSLESLGFTSQPPQLPLPSEIESTKPENVLHIQREDGRVASFQFLPTRFSMFSQSSEYKYVFLVWH